MELSAANRETIAKLRDQAHKFKKACRQIIILSHRIKDKQTRYDRAYTKNQRVWRYSLRLQLAVLEGMRNMFLEYAYRRADEIEALQDVLVAEGLMSDTEEELDLN